jgi:hypothetical protein
MTAAGEPIGVGRTDTRRSASNENCRDWGLHDEPHLFITFIMITIMSPIMYNVNGEVERGGLL